MAHLIPGQRKLIYLLMDKLSTKQRSANMRAVRGKNTKPEIAVRRTVHAMGYRFRLHRRDLPGSPDLVFPALKLALFVHGCFWHMHPGCSKSTFPTTNTEFWREKLLRNVERDQLAQQALREAGWCVGVIWECETIKAADICKRLKNILPPRPFQKRRMKTTATR